MHLLVLGLGYSARHALGRLRPRFDRITGTTRTPEKAARLAAAGVEAVVYDGAAPADGIVRALADATHLLVSVGPDRAGDPVLARHRGDIGAALASGRLRWVGYYSTVGVYGDAGGGAVDDDAPLAPVSERSRWRVAAERDWTGMCAAAGVPVALLRLAGIYGPGRNAFVNLAAGTARRIVRPGQVFNRVHVADIAAATEAALAAGATGPINVADDEPAPPQDPIAFAARLMGVPVPPEIPYEAAEMSPMARSFWGENKRVVNRRLRGELGVALAFPTYREGLTALWESGTWRGDDDDRDEASPRFRRVTG